MDELDLKDLTFLYQLVVNFSAPVKDAQLYLALAQKLANMAQKKQPIAPQEGDISG